MPVDNHAATVHAPAGLPPGRHVNTVTVVTILALAASLHQTGMRGMLFLDHVLTPFPQERTMEAQTATLTQMVEGARHIVVSNLASRTIRTEFIRGETSWMQHASQPHYTARAPHYRPIRL